MERVGQWLLLQSLEFADGPVHSGMVDVVRTRQVWRQFDKRVRVGAARG